VNVFPKLSETFIANELVELRRRGLEVRVLSLRPRPEGQEHSFIAQTGLDQLTSWNPSEFPSVLRQFRPQWLHAHFATEPAAAARLLAAEAGCPFTFTAHGYDIRRKPPPDFAARAAAARAVITVSEANAHYITDTFGVPRSRVHVIPCGIDTKLFQPAPDAQRQKRNGHVPLIVCVARLAKVKRLTLLLEACALLRARHASFRCVLVGEGPCRGELEEMRARLQLEPWVELMGAATQGQVLEWWQGASVGVLTSENEGMPVSLMEAGACGLPVVATAVGGIPELVASGRTGLLAPSGDASALAAHLEKILQDPPLAAALGVAARRRVQELFGVSRQVDRLLGLWTNCLAEGGACAG